MAINIQEQVPMNAWTTFKTGGPAQFLVEVKTEEELAEAVAYARANSLPINIVGGGSNILVPDQGVEGLVILMRIRGCEFHHDKDCVYVTVGAGEELDDLIGELVAAGYWGLENLSAIPGTVGAAPVQNVGAYGVEVGDSIALVRVFDRERESFASLSAEDCRFAYRDSLFKHEGGKRYVVTAVTFRLFLEPRPQLTYRDLAERFSGAAPSLSDIREAIIDIRSHKFPDWRVVGTAGSFFKNPIITRVQYEELLLRYSNLPKYDVDEERVKVPLGWIFDHVLKVRGHGTETVGCYEGQALVLFNRGHATTDDVISFADYLAMQVKNEMNINVEREVVVLMNEK